MGIGYILECKNCNREFELLYQNRGADELIQNEDLEEFRKKYDDIYNKIEFYSKEYFPFYCNKCKVIENRILFPFKIKSDYSKDPRLLEKVIKVAKNKYIVKQYCNSCNAEMDYIEEPDKSTLKCCNCNTDLVIKYNILYD